MSSRNRPTKRDWIAGVLIGAGLGLLLLGVGGRAGMRIFALANGQAPLFTIEGSIAVSLLGAGAGALIGVTFMLVRAMFPRLRYTRAAFFWAVCVGMALRGLHPVDAIKLSIFLPLFLLHGALLHLLWCRVYLRRTIQLQAGL